MPKDEEKPLTPEEREALLKLQEGWNSNIQKILGPIYNIFEWCWPATIGLFAFQQFYALFTGVVPYSFWIVTVFLWIPLVLMLSVTAIVILFCYLLAFFSSWTKFLTMVLFYLKIGFEDANKKDGKTDER